MGKLYPELDERLTKFIARQSVFFVATAPCLTADGDGGHVNVSPRATATPSPYSVRCRSPTWI